MEKPGKYAVKFVPAEPRRTPTPLKYRGKHEPYVGSHRGYGDVAPRGANIGKVAAWLLTCLLVGFIAFTLIASTNLVLRIIAASVCTLAVLVGVVFLIRDALKARDEVTPEFLAQVKAQISKVGRS